MSAEEATTGSRSARGGLTGSLRARADRRPNLRGSITLEADMRAGERLWLSGWTKIEPASGAEWISIEAEKAGKGGRARK